MNDKAKTRDHNLKVLIEDLGFIKVRNTTVFQNKNNFILSPSVAESLNGKYWFDIREVNLQRLNNDAYLLVRIVPDLFIFEKITSIKQLLSKQVMDNRPESGKVWSINIDISAKTAHLFNIKKTTAKIKTTLLNKNELLNAYHDINK